MKKGAKIFIAIVLLLILVIIISSSRNKEETVLPEQNGIQTGDEKKEVSNPPPGINFGVDLDVVESLLTESEWQWVDTVYSDGTAVTPKDPSKFSLVFSENGKFSGKTDCNDIAGEYKLGEGAITFSKIASTKKACAGVVQEAKFIEMLEKTEGFIFTADGALALTLELDSGSVIFEPVR